MKSCLVNSVLFLFFASLFVQAGFKKHSTIDPKKCDFDGLCLEVCPVQAMHATKYNGKDVYIIDVNKCTNCGACIQVCLKKAITPDSTDLSAKKTSDSDKNSAGKNTAVVQSPDKKGSDAVKKEDKKKK
jgi:Fe-S-cluster-containing hydrogenase component 2